MVELGAIAGIPVVAILTCLLKCAVEVGNVDEHPDEVQNLLYLQCLADCLLPSGLPDPDRYKDEGDQQESDSTQNSTEDNSNSAQNSTEDGDLKPPDEQKTITSGETVSTNVNNTTIDIETEFKTNATVITIQDSEKDKKIDNENFDNLYRPDRDTESKIEELARMELGKGSDVLLTPLTITVVIPGVQHRYLDQFQEGVIDILHSENDQ